MIEEKLINYLKDENVSGAFLIKDLSDREVFKFNHELKVPSASLIKMFILIKAFEEIKAGKITYEKEIEVGAKDIVPFSVLEFLKPRKYCLEELLRLMIVYSDNTATNVLVDFFGMEGINQTIKSLGCNNSIMQRKMMDFDAAKEGRQNYTSVEDMAGILERIYDNNLLGAPYDEDMLEIMKGQADETMMRQHLPDEIEIARKSGELDALDHDIAIVYTEKRNYLYVFFSWNANDNNHARDILDKSSKWVYDYYINKK